MQKSNRKKRNNKGFSMVELIIVIAIMAALVGILAPQYIKYVERSRVSVDVATLDELVRAVQVSVADPDSPLADGTYDITVASGVGTVPAGLNIADTFGATFTLKSSAAKTAAGTKVQIVVSSHVVSCTLTYNPTTKAWANSAT